MATLSCRRRGSALCCPHASKKRIAHRLLTIAPPQIKVSLKDSQLSLERPPNPLKGAYIPANRWMAKPPLGGWGVSQGTVGGLSGRVFGGTFWLSFLSSFFLKNHLCAWRTAGKIARGCEYANFRHIRKRLAANGFRFPYNRRSFFFSVARPERPRQRASFAIPRRPFRVPTELV